MSWDAAFAPEAERVAIDLARRPAAVRPREASVWAQAGALFAAPYTGLAQGVNESIRVAYRSATASADDVLRRQQQEADDFTAEAIFRRRLELDDERAQADAQLRAAVDYWRPNPETVSTASRIVHEVSRVIGKVAIVGSLTRSPLATAAAVGADEGGATYLDLRDQGVDPATAAKVGAVSGVSTAVGIALPASAPTLAGKAALVAVGGPGSFVAENVAAREILRAADFGEIAERYDPTDPTGLVVSTLVSGVAATVGGRIKPTRTQIDAAQVTLRNQELQAKSLADSADPVLATAHLRALDETRAAIDEGRPVNAASLAPIDTQRAGAELAALREAADEIEQLAPRAITDDRPVPVTGAADDAAISARVQQFLAERPDIEIRTGDEADAPVVRAAEVLTRADDEVRMAKTEGDAYRAAVTCFLGRGA